MSAARGSRNLPGTKTRGGVSPALELAQKLTGLGAIAAGDFLVGGHAALARRGIALELVLVVHAFAHALASAGHAHALLAAAVRLPEDPGICPGRRPVEGSHLPLSLPRSLRALARSPPVISWSVATRRLRAEVLPSNLCWLFTPSRMILPVPVTRMRFLALLFVFCFGMVPFSFAIRRRRQPPATTSHAQTAEGLERDVD